MNEKAAKKHPDFAQYKQYLSESFTLQPEAKERLERMSEHDLYSAGSWLDLNSIQIAQHIAGFLHVPYLSLIDPGMIISGVLPLAFSRTNHVVAVTYNNKQPVFIVANPFDIDLIDMLNRVQGAQGKDIDFILAAPESIESVLKVSTLSSDSSAASEIAFSRDRDKTMVVPAVEQKVSVELAEDSEYPTLNIANNLLQSAVRERASDIHIEPKKDETIIRFRIDGDMRLVQTLKKKVGIMLISRFRVIGEMDFAEKRKPQDGTVEATIDNRSFKLRLTTTSTPDGESMIIRLLEPNAQPKQLHELGMSEEQSEILKQVTYRTQGLILIVGPTGSGKTTTIYSLLSHLDCKTRSLVTIEDPVEYRIPFANHQQVNEKAGVTFEALLKSIVRQDPDIIFLGEIRDQYSARMAVDFASTGHLAISSLHTTNATTALFRLERLGLSRSIMAEALLCIIAQRLIKKLCIHCRKVAPISDEERKILEPFMAQLPEEVGHPAGCIYCQNTGYHGREGVYEIFTLSPDVTELIRNGTAIGQIREYYGKHGGFLIGDHALTKITNYTFSVKDVYEKILVEELSTSSKTVSAQMKAAPAATSPAETIPSVLIVDDDPEIHRLLETILKNQGYRVSSAYDGVDALVALSTDHFDLILSDVNMPNLDGFKFIEIMTEKNIATPLVFLTSRTEPEDEMKGLQLGAVDYIKKPIQKDILLLRLKKIMRG